ncbi:PREDICTED: scavenger receptor class F member 2 isoform X1 [Hipposideros armiger]|uniref:Scavenger receptor class F member 2 isoform X1 n=1 Tax=Hipposideros armiger TaxID=186990 RepID=A0A8B7QHR4_HIPAR|nr:PREDICTED: scavenger receptor class F member 2 isoform X1 [Hipposideros armiger]
MGLGLRRPLSACSSQEPTCCTGWRQQGDECGIAVCEGNSTCSENEVCVRPGECRCRHGYFGANCDTKCPRQFWGPDCKELCICHPHGQCEDVTGQCTCHARRWGARCEHACQCQHGSCHPRSGACRCEPGWWGAQCASACYCSATSRCDPQTGACLCHAGWWGRSCNNQCACNTSPCEQQSGRCQCRERTFGARCERYCQCFHGRCHPVDGTCACEPGYRGKYCREPCPAGFYGLGCRRRCGQCKGQQPCTVAEGRCLTCEPGWNGTKCDQPCATGFYGEGCGNRCPPCRDGHACNHVTGKCTRCNAGWIGDRCETKCSNGTYGEDCAFVCADCGSGHCDFQSGRCLCRPGVHGPHCNLTCPPGLHGVDCAQACSCHEDSCDPVTGACRLETNQRKGVMGAGALLALLLGLLLSLLGCCCACRGKDPARRPRPRRELSLGRKKAPQRLCGRFSRISMKLPRIPLRRQKLPKVVDKRKWGLSFLWPITTWITRSTVASWSHPQGWSSPHHHGPPGPPSPPLTPPMKVLCTVYPTRRRQLKAGMWRSPQSLLSHRRRLLRRCPRRMRRPSPRPLTASGRRRAWRGLAGHCTHAWPGARPGRPGPGERLGACRFRHRLSAGNRRHPTPPPNPRCPGFTASTAPPPPPLPVRLHRHPRAPRRHPVPARGNGRPATRLRDRRSPAVPGPATRLHGPRGWPKRGQPSRRPHRPGLGRGGAALASQSQRTLAVPRAARQRPPPCWLQSCATRLAAWAAPRVPRAHKVPGRSQRLRRRPSAQFCPPRQPARPLHPRPQGPRRWRLALPCPTPPGRRPPSRSHHARRAGKRGASWSRQVHPLCSRRRPAAPAASPGFAALLVPLRCAPGRRLLRLPERGSLALAEAPSVGRRLRLIGSGPDGGSLIGAPRFGGKSPFHWSKPDRLLAGDSLPIDRVMEGSGHPRSKGWDRRVLPRDHLLLAKYAFGWGCLLIG